MLSVIEVKCPHCGVKGQIILPPLGSLVMGPCPKCEGLVLLFCGRALAIDRDVMYEGTFEEKREHLMTVLMDALEKSIAQLAAEVAAPTDDAHAEADAELAGGPLDAPIDAARFGRRRESPDAPPITQAEVEQFVETDLKRIDDRAYFRSIFSR